MALSLTVTSCEKFLDVKPQSQIPTEDLFLKENGFEDALMGCYVKMTSQDLYGSFLSYGGIDHMAQYYSHPSASSMEGALREFNYKNEFVEMQLKATYNDFYNAILHANEVIEHINLPNAAEVVKSEAKRNMLKGEALALRAYLHFDVQRLFGQMPQNAEKTISLPYSEVTGVEDRPLYNFNDYLGKVLADLSEAEKLLAEDPAITYNLREQMHEEVEDNFMQYRKFRMNYYAVKALQARVYLYIGEKEKAYAAAKELVDLKEANGQNYFKLAGEEDFSHGHYALPSETIFGLSSAQLDDPNVDHLFTNREPSSFEMNFSIQRKNEMFHGRNTAVNNRYGKIWGTQTSVVGTQLNIYKKYLQNDKNPSDTDKLNFRCFYPMLRFSEIYLIMMETSDNLDEINQLFYTYMVARNEQPAPFENIEAAKEEIIKEYRREFMAEGQMFFTYKRLGTEQMLWRNQSVGENNYIAPVPASEIVK